MTLGLLLVALVALVLLVGGALVSGRSSAGRSLEHELAVGAEREPWARAVDAPVAERPSRPVTAAARAA